MRCLALISMTLVSTPALADSRTSGSAGGALGRTNAGIGAAVHGSHGSSHSSSSSGGGASTGSSWQGGGTSTYYPECASCGGVTTIVADPAASTLPEEREEGPDYYTGDRARFAGYIGLQKVHDSDGSGTVELSVTDYRFRLSGALSHYVEDQIGGGRTTLTLPSVMVGLRLSGRGNTQLYVDGGVSVAISRGAPAMDTSITAPTIGAQLVQYVSDELTLLGDVRAMFFGDGVQAVAGKVGIKLNWAQLSMRVLDFNVGPALWGPELGLAF